MPEQVLEEAEEAGVSIDAKKFPLPNTYRWWSRLQVVVVPLPQLGGSTKLTLQHLNRPADAVPTAAAGPFSTSTAP